MALDTPLLDHSHRPIIISDMTARFVPVSRRIFRGLQLLRRSGCRGRLSRGVRRSRNRQCVEARAGLGPRRLRGVAPRSGGVADGAGRNPESVDRAARLRAVGSGGSGASDAGSGSRQRRRTRSGSRARGPGPAAPEGPWPRRRREGSRPRGPGRPTPRPQPTGSRPGGTQGPGSVNAVATSSCVPACAGADEASSAADAIRDDAPATGSEGVGTRGGTSVAVTMPGVSPPSPDSRRRDSRDASESPIAARSGGDGDGRRCQAGLDRHRPDQRVRDEIERPRVRVRDCGRRGRNRKTGVRRGHDLRLRDTGGGADPRRPVGAPGRARPRLATTTDRPGSMPPDPAPGARGRPEPRSDRSPRPAPGQILKGRLTGRRRTANRQGHHQGYRSREPGRTHGPASSRATAAPSRPGSGAAGKFGPSSWGVPPATAAWTADSRPWSDPRARWSRRCRPGRCPNQGLPFLPAAVRRDRQTKLGRQRNSRPRCPGARRPRGSGASRPALAREGHWNREPLRTPTARSGSTATREARWAGRRPSSISLVSD